MKTVKYELVGVMAKRGEGDLQAKSRSNRQISEKSLSYPHVKQGIVVSLKSSTEHPELHTRRAIQRKKKSVQNLNTFYQQLFDIFDDEADGL